MSLCTFVWSLSYCRYLMYPHGVSSRQKPVLWLLCILCWGWERLLLRKYLKGWILQDGHSAHTELSPCAMEALFLPLSYSASIALQTSSGFGCKKIKGLEWCYKVLEILRFMPKPQWAVGTEGVESEMLEMGKQDVAQCSPFFMVFVLHWPRKSTNLNWIWVPQGHHEWLYNH